MHLGLHGEVAEGVRGLRAFGRQRVEVARRGELHGLQRLLGGEAADDDGEMIGRAGGGAERQDLLLEERHQPLPGQHRRRRLVEEGLVRRAAALRHEQELVGVLTLGIDLDLRRQVRARVDLLEHRQRRDLRIAQVLLEIRVADALRDRALVRAVGQDGAALLAHDDRGAGVLAHRQDAAGGDVSVLEEVVGDELVVSRRLGIVEDRGELPKVPRPQEMVDVDHRLLGEPPDRLALDDDDLTRAEPLDAHAVGGEPAVGRRVRAEREQLAMDIGRLGGHCGQGSGEVAGRRACNGSPAPPLLRGEPKRKAHVDLIVGHFRPDRAARDRASTPRARRAPWS